MSDPSEYRPLNGRDFARCTWFAAFGMAFGIAAEWWWVGATNNASPIWLAFPVAIIVALGFAVLIWGDALLKKIGERGW